MQFSDDESIKGDYSVKATGVSSLIAKEVLANSLMQFANMTNNPSDISITKRAKIIREIANSLDLSEKELVLTDKEIQVNNQQQLRQQTEERQFMLKMIETAREYGISPNDMIENMRLGRQDLINTQNQAAPQQELAGA
jgi:hypothetical protein